MAETPIRDCELSDELRADILLLAARALLEVAETHGLKGAESPMFTKVTRVLKFLDATKGASRE